MTIVPKDLLQEEELGIIMRSDKGAFVREMKLSDWDEMMAIFQESLDKGVITFRTECPSYQFWDETHSKECRLVCEYEGRVAGFAAVAPTSYRQSFKGVVECSIYVGEEFHHKGIGTLLIEALKKDAERQGFWTLFAQIFATNKASIALFNKCGFRTIGTREDIAKNSLGEWQSTVIMEWRNSIK